MFKCYKYVCLYGRWCTHLQYSRSQLATYTITRNPPSSLLSFSSLLYKLMSGSDTEELPTAGDLNNKLGASYLCNVVPCDPCKCLCDTRVQHLISIIFLCIGQCMLITSITGRCCLWRCIGLVPDTFGRDSYLRKDGDCSSFEVECDRHTLIIYPLSSTPCCTCSTSVVHTMTCAWVLTQGWPWRRFTIIYYALFLHSKNNNLIAHSLKFSSHIRHCGYWSNCDSPINLIFKSPKVVSVWLQCVPPLLRLSFWGAV